MAKLKNLVAHPFILAKSKKRSPIFKQQANRTAT
jgi:hypothetical protein